MSDVTILNLPVAVGVTGTEYVPIVQAGTTKRAQLSLLASLSNLPTIANNTMLANISGATAQPGAVTQTQMLDTIGSTQGDILYRAASSWVRLAAGTAGQFLKTAGAGANPLWADVTASAAGSTTQIQYNSAGSLAGSANLTFASSTLTIGSAATATGILALAGSTSGTVSVQPANVAGTWTMTLPTSAGTSGYVLQTDGTGATSWVAQSGTPAGSTTQVQFNNAGSFGASANLRFATSTLTIGTAASATGVLALTGSTSGTISVQGQAVAGTYNFNLPTTAGTSGQPLLSGGGGATAMSFGTLSVGGGGTGQTTLTNHGVLVGAATSGITALAAAAAGTLLSGVAGSDPAFTSTPTLGISGSVLGTIALAGSTSGVVTVQPQVAAGTYNFNLPTSAGTSGQPLLSGGGGASAMTFGTLSVGGGGTGQTTLTNHGVLVGAATSGITALAAAAAGTILAGVTGADPAFTATPTLGVQQTTQGQLVLANTAVGAFATTLQSSNSASAAWTLTLPTSAGTNGQALTTNGSGVTSWTTLSASPAGSNTQIQFNNSSAFGASANLTFVTSTLTVGVAGSAIGTLALTGSTSGTISIQGQAVAGTYNFNLPTGAGTSGQPLLSGGGGATAMTFGTLGVGAGGTGLTSGTSGGVPYFSSSSAISSSAALTSGAVVLGGGAGAAPNVSANLNFATSTLSIGANASALGAVKMFGSTSGDVTVQAAAVAGTATLFQLPASNGSSGQYLQTNGSGVTSWQTVSANPGGSSLQLQYNNASAFGGMSGTSWDETNRSLTITGATVTTSKPVFDLTQTWNAGGVAFSAFRVNVTNTASAPGAAIIDAQVGGNSAFRVWPESYVSGQGGVATVNRWGIPGVGHDSANGAFISFSSGGNCTIGASATPSIYMSALGGATATMALNNTTIAFGNGVNAQDAFFRRAAAATLQFGAADAAAPVAQTQQVQSVVAGTTNTAGQPWTLIGSLSTGSGTSGDIVIQTGGTGAAPTVKNTATTALTIKGGTQQVICASTLKTLSTTVASLPSASTAGSGSRAFVTDATSTTYLSTVAGGGSNKVPVVSDGTNWLIG